MAVEHQKTRGEYKTPGGKLVGINLEWNSRGEIIDCRIDGDFFVESEDYRNQDIDGMIKAFFETLQNALRNGGTVESVMSQYPTIRIIGADSHAFYSAFSRAIAEYDSKEYDNTGSSIDTFPPEGGIASSETVVSNDTFARSTNAITGVDVLANERITGWAKGNSVSEHDSVTGASNQVSQYNKWSKRWRELNPDVIHDIARSPEEQMIIDESWAKLVAQRIMPPTLRIWEWSSSAVVIGKFQSLHDQVNLEEAKRYGIDVVRRCTGGGAMFIEPGNTITYSLYAPLSFVQGMSIEESYKLCDSWLIEALRQLGIDAGFSGLNDIASSQGKIGGAAQRRFPATGEGTGSILHHVTMAYDIDAGKMSRVLNISQEKLSDKAVKSVVKRVDPLRSQTGLSRDALVAHLVSVAHSWG